MFISLLAALERSTGKTTILASAGSVAVGGDCSKVTAQYAKFLTGDDAGNKLRAKYSSILLIQDNMVRNRHEFPDVEKSRKSDQDQADRAAAIEVLAAAEAEHATALRKAEAARLLFEQARNQAASLGIKTPAVNQAAAEAAAKEAADKAAAEEAAAAKEAADRAAAEEAAAQKAAEESAPK